MKLNEERIALCAVRVIVLGQVIGDRYRVRLAMARSQRWDIGARHGRLDKRALHGAPGRRGCLCRRRSSREKRCTHEGGGGHMRFHDIHLLFRAEINTTQETTLFPEDALM